MIIMTDYSFLDGYEGKIVLLSSPYEKWKEEREKYLYNGKITNQRLREILDKEMIIEFDHLQEWEIGSEQFKKAREETDKWIREVKAVLQEQNKYFKITDHLGKSPHIRFNVEGLEHYPKQYAQEYKLRLAEAILEEIGFKSELVELDRSLLTSDKKLISLEGMPHFKEKWKGNVEEVIYEHTSGEKYKVQKERMDEIIKELNQSIKTDKAEINLNPVDIKDVDVQGLIQIWKEHYKEGYRNALLMALGGLCRRKGISLEESEKLLKTLLEAVGKPEYYYNTSKELSYSWNYKPEEVAVFSHLKRIGDKAEEIYKCMKKCFVNNTTTTSNYLTTSNYTTTLRSWGLLDPDKDLYIEQLNRFTYLYNKSGKKGIAEVQTEKDEDTKRWEIFLVIDNQRIYFSNFIMEAPYNTPSPELIERYVKGEYKPRSFKEIISDVIKLLEALYDFKFDTDKTIIQLAIGQSYLVPMLESLFYLGIDATKGGGKTTLLELITYLQRHGYMAGDTSASSIPRLVHELQLSIGIDEIDQKTGATGEADNVAILRKGQRKNNPYVRCEGRNNTPRAYDVFGSHSFTFRSELEDAFMSRTLPIHSAKTNDNKLPVINVVKRKILKPLADELFLWNMDNINRLFKEYSNRSNLIFLPTTKSHDDKTGVCSNVVGCSGNLKNQKISEIRNYLYKEITKHLDPEALEVLEKVTGRNTELSFIALDIAKVLDLDIVPNLKQVMNAKEETESISESYYLESLEEFLNNKHNSIKGDDSYLKKDGLHSGMIFYPKNLIYQEYVQDLQNKAIHPIGTKKYNSLLRDLGFLEGDTIMNIRVNRIPKMCIIFSDKIQYRLNIKERKEEQDEIKSSIQKAILKHIKSHPKDNAVEIEEQYGKDILNSMLKEGKIFENPSGTYQVM